MINESNIKNVVAEMQEMLRDEDCLEVALIATVLMHVTINPMSENKKELLADILNAGLHRRIVKEIETEALYVPGL